MSQAEQLVAGLGGTKNINIVESCITRLRIEVDNEAKVDEAALVKAGAVGIVQTGHDVQIAIGPTADTVAEDMKALL